MSTIPQILKDCRTSMEKGLDAAKREFSSVRSGKASPNRDLSKVKTLRSNIAGPAAFTINCKRSLPISSAARSM